MSGVICNCDLGGGNLGTPTCYAVFDVAIKAMLVEYYKPDGTVNGIDLSALASGGTILDQAFLDSKVKDLDSRTRYYATPALKNIVDERGDDITEDLEDGTSLFIREGARTFEGLIIKGDPVLLGNLQKWKCLTAGVFFIDKSGNLIGKKTRDGFLDPILLEDESFSAGLIKTTDTTKQKDRIRFTVSQLENDANLRMIEAVSITADLIGVRGLLDVVASNITNITTTTFTVDLNTQFGGCVTPSRAQGLLAADFSAYDNTLGAPVALTSVTETSPGVYDFVFPVLASLTELIISNKLAGTLDKNYDVVPFTVNIP